MIKIKTYVSDVRYPKYMYRNKDNYRHSSRAVIVDVKFLGILIYRRITAA